MIDKQAAEELAKKFVGEYMKQCGCETPQDFLNALGLVIMTCGIGAALIVGEEDALKILDHAAQVITVSEVDKFRDKKQKQKH